MSGCNCNKFEGFYLKIEMVDETVKKPNRAHESDAGMDVYSPEDYTIPPRSDVCIPLGFKTEFPSGYALIFHEKSGRATKDKISIGAKVVDANYRGIVHGHLFNNSDKEIVIKKNEKITQFIIFPILNCQAEFSKVDEDTDRGSGGFGSSGLK